MKTRGPFHGGLSRLSPMCRLVSINYGVVLTCEAKVAVIVLRAAPSRQFSPRPLGQFWVASIVDKPQNADDNSSGGNVSILPKKVVHHATMTLDYCCASLRASERLRFRRGFSDGAPFKFGP